MRTLFVAALAALGVALAVAVVPAGSGGSDPLELEPTGSTTPVTTSTGGANDISGPCDEPEHRSDPRCAGVAGAVTAPAVTNADISGPCDEAEHRNDPRCAGGGAAGADDDRSGDDRATNDNDDDDDRSGSNSGPH